MTSLTNWLKNCDRLKKIYSKTIIFFSPKRRYFNNNLKKVYQFDQQNNTDFGGRLYQNEIGTNKDRANDYSPSPDKLIKTLKRLGITENDCIVDIGCGKGYAMYVMLGFPFRFVGGVELSSKLCDIAVDNLSKVYSDKSNYGVYCCDAGMWDGYDSYNYFYMYNPFPEEVVREVKEKIEESIERSPREVTILYLMPRCAEVFIDDEKWKLVSRGAVLEQKRGMNIFKNRM